MQAPAPGSEQLAATAPNSAPAPFAGPVEFTPLPAPQAHPTNLPVQVTSFIGREREIDEAGALLRGDRLVTLMGAGGVGKTRLALALAAEVLGTYSDGVWWVALAPLADPSLVVQTVAQVFGLREEPNRPLLITLLDQLKDRQVLLVLDNCEHLVGACADLTAALLSACRSVHILATSQEGLGVAGERLYRVPSLDAPPLTQPTTPAHLGEYAAVQLFVARAQERRVEFTLGKQNAGAVARMTLLQTGKS